MRPLHLPLGVVLFEGLNRGGICLKHPAVKSVCLPKWPTAIWAEHAGALSRPHDGHGQRLKSDEYHIP